jgi:hypothetical protein
MHTPSLFSLFLICYVTFAKPIRDIDHHAVSIADNVDVNKMKLTITTPDPLLSTQSSSTQLIYISKLDEEIDNESESEEDHTTIPNITTTQELPSQFNHQLSVEEFENAAAFDENHEVFAKKPKAQIVRTANTGKFKSVKLPFLVIASTNLPQIASSTNEPPSKPESVLNKKQTTDKMENFKGIDQSPMFNDDHIKEMPNDGPEEMDHNLNLKIPINPKPQSMYGESEEITSDIVQTLTTPSAILESTPKPTEVQEKSVLKSIIDGFLCSKGNCKNVFASSTTPKPHELTQISIIRRVRHNDGIVELECKCGSESKSNS